MGQYTSGLFAEQLPDNGSFGKKATILCVSLPDLKRLVNNDTIFVPSIDREDEDSVIDGPTKKFTRRGYQRPAEQSRIRKIGRYYRQEDLLGFTTPIITAVRKDLDHKDLVSALEKSMEGSSRRVSEHERILAIIDGQHRVEGLLAEARNNGADPLRIQVIMVCFHNLSYEEETKTFDVINTTPKRLPKALTEWNKYGITEKYSNSHEQQIRAICVHLGTDEDSVWRDKINFTGTGRDPSKPVTLEGMRRSTLSMFPGSLKYLDKEVKVELAKLFWHSVSETFPEAWNNRQKEVDADNGKGKSQTVTTGTTVKLINGTKRTIPAVQYRLTDLVGVASLAKIAGEIMTEAHGVGKNDGDQILRDEYIKSEVDKLSEVDWEKNPRNAWTNGQAGFAGLKGTYEALAYLRANGIAPWEALEDKRDQPVNSGGYEI